MNLVSSLTSFAQVVVQQDPEAIASIQTDTQEVAYIYYAIPAAIIGMLVVYVILRRQKKRYRR